MSVNARAALLMTLAMAGFAFEDALLKFLSSDLSIGQLLLLLGFGGMVAFGAWVALGPEGLRWRDLIHPGVLLRNLCEAVCGVFFLTAISIGDLAIASAILQALPLLMTLGAALILGEKVGWRRWASIGAGFLGVLMIVRPGTSVPSASASSTIALAMRSFTEPAGFWPSSLTRIRAPGCGLSALTSTIGVLPMRSSTEE